MDTVKSDFIRNYINEHNIYQCVNIINNKMNT